MILFILEPTRFFSKDCASLRDSYTLYVASRYSFQLPVWDFVRTPNNLPLKPSFMWLIITRIQGSPLELSNTWPISTIHGSIFGIYPHRQRYVWQVMRTTSFIFCLRLQARKSKQIESAWSLDHHQTCSV